MCVATFQYNALDKISRDVNWCPSNGDDSTISYNDAIGRNGETLQMLTNITTYEHATSLKIVIQNEWTMAVMGMDSGKIIKVCVFLAGLFISNAMSRFRHLCER